MMESRHLADAVCCVCERSAGIDTDEARSASAASVRTTMTYSQTEHLSASSLFCARCRLIDWSFTGLTPAPSSPHPFLSAGSSWVSLTSSGRTGEREERDRAEEEYIHFAVAI